MGERGLYALYREKHTLADALTLATTHSLTKKFLGSYLRPSGARRWRGTGVLLSYALSWQ